MTTLLGLPKVSTENSEEVPTTSTRFSSGLPSVSILRSTGMRKVSRSWKSAQDFDALLFGIAFGFDLEVDRHAEGVQVLGDFPHDAKAFGGAQDGVFQLELGGSAGFNPLDEEVAQILAAGGFGDLAEIVGIGALPGVLLGERLERFEEILVSHNVAQHADDGGALTGGERPDRKSVV